MARSPHFTRATVTRVVSESADAFTLVLAPEEPFTYRAGQFCTFRITVDGEVLLRSYSMSTAPETDTELATTIKRVPGGRVSNWLADHVVAGDVVELTPPAGTFLLRPGTGPVLGFAGGSGITPILSLVKSALAGTDRPVRVFCADRLPEHVLFTEELCRLAQAHPGRLTVHRHLDSESGVPTAATIQAFVGTDSTAEAYLCGPEPFMDMVTAALPPQVTLYTERFGTPGSSAVVDADAEALPADATVTFLLNRRRTEVPCHAGETLLESARRAGLSPPFSCEAGSCGTCVATVTEGRTTMRVNDVLEEWEVAEGCVLTCQAVPVGGSVVVQYD